MNITKAKVTKDNTLVATYTDETGTVTVEGKNLVTNDLINAFKALVPHMAFLCEQKEADGKNFLEDMPNNIDSILEVTGYTVGGDGDSRGVTLTGKRFLKSNKVLNLNAPFTKFADENEDYAFQFELEQAIESCCYEVMSISSIKNGRLCSRNFRLRNRQQQMFRQTKYRKLKRKLLPIRTLRLFRR